MTATEVREGLVGQRIKRREDPRLVRGQARYMDDIVLPGMLHLKFARSPVAHGRIRSIDTSAAEQAGGVVGVFTASDFEDVNPLPYAFRAAGVENFVNTPTVLAKDKVRYVGEPVALVVAESPQQAADALELINIDIEELPAVVDAELTTHDGAPQLHENAPNNIAFDWQCGDEEGTNQALENAEVRVKQRLRNQRLIPEPMETRGAIGQYDPGTDEYTFWLPSQAPHVHRLLMAAFVLGVPEEKIRVIAPDLGGAFGSKIDMYAEYPLVGVLSKRLGRPVKWIETREEHHMAVTHGRDHVTDLEVAATRDGRITGLKVTTWANIGAYLSTIAGGVPTTLYAKVLSGAYKIPNIHARVIGTYTNTAMVDALRGAGRPEATYVIERAVDLVARALDMDPTEVRRINFIPSDEFPYYTGLSSLPYDTGNYPTALDKALSMIGYDEIRAQQKQRSDGKLLGIGFSSYIEACGMAPTAWISAEGWGAGLWESANIRVHLTGKVVVTTGAMPHGQGHETTFAQIVADELGVPIEDIDVQYGDTLGTPFGYGSYGSRSLAVGGTAVTKTAQKIREKMEKIAAHMLEVDPSEIDFEAGKAFVRGAPDRSVTVAEIAATAAVGASLPEGVEPYLDETTYYDPPNLTYPFGTHIAVVEVDEQTGQVDLVRYVAVDDVGNVINPLIVDGQVQGGIVHGVGQALWEEAVYDENGQLASSTLMDYAVPKASQFPMFELDRTVTTTPVNPLGAKGVGEAGTIASTAAVVNAVMDALAPLGINHLDMPLSAPKVWAAIQKAKES